VNEGLDGEVAWVATNDRVQRLSAAADIGRMRRIAMHLVHCAIASATPSTCADAKAGAEGNICHVTIR